MAVVHHVDQVLAVGGDEGPVVGGQAHGLGLLVAHAVGCVQAHHVTRVRLVQRHQIELKVDNRRPLVTPRWRSLCGWKTPPLNIWTYTHI